MPPERYIKPQRILDVLMKPREKPYLKTMFLIPFLIRKILERSSNENVTITTLKFRDNLWHLFQGHTLKHAVHKIKQQE